MKLFTAALLAAILVAGVGCKKDDGGDHPTQITLSATYPGPFVLEGDKEYLITGNVVFQDSLLVEAGARLTARGEYLVTVQGALLVDGSADSPVRLTTTEDFLGIRVLGPSADLRELSISGLGQGLVMQNTQCQIQGLDLQSCIVGLWIANSDVVLSDVSAQGCEEAVRIEQCTLQATGLSLVDCQTGLTCSTTTGTLSSSTISGCLTGVASNTGDQVEISNSVFLQNNYGITYFYGRPHVTHCTFDGNNYNVFLKVYPRWDVVIQQCNFLNPGTYNVATDNVVYNNPHQLDISGNWWGGIVESQIAASIRDGVDTGTADTLVFLPAATAAWAH